MSKFGNDDFLAKFGDRVEKVGRDGVMGLMKSTGNPINLNRQNIYTNQNNFNIYKGRNDLREIHKNILEDNYNSYSPRNKNNIYINKFPASSKEIRNIKHYSFLNNDNTEILSKRASMPTLNDNIMKDINYRQRNSLLRSMKVATNSNDLFNQNNEDFNPRNQIRKNSVNYRYNGGLNNLLEQKTNFSLPPRNIYTVANNRQNIVDHGYTPYTLKDYKKISNEVKLGKLGPNIGTEDWVKKRNRMKKMSEYGNKVIYEGTGCKNKVSESAEERHRRLQEIKALNGKWNIINEYSKGLMINKDKNNNEQFKRNVNDKLLEEERLIDKQFELDIRDNEEEERMLQQQNNILYQQRLNKMKNLLFK